MPKECERDCIKNVVNDDVNNYVNNEFVNNNVAFFLNLNRVSQNEDKLA